MKRPRKYRLTQPARQTEPASPPEVAVLQPRRSVPAGPAVTPLPGSPAPEVAVLSPADEVEVLVAPRIPRRWLRVAFALAPDADPARAALAAAWLVTRLRAADKRLRLTIDREKSSATANEVVLMFAPTRGGSLVAGWLEEVKAVVRDIASEFDGAELRSVEVVSEG